jgi:N-acetylglutamate synthase-like GNAT family acetyltransferase
MEIEIKKTIEFEKAFLIAQSLPEYFNEGGLNQIKEDLPIQIVFGAYEDDNLLAFISYNEINEQTVELSWLAVKEDKQRKGVGTKLVRESLKEIGQAYDLCQVKTLAETVEDEGYARTRNFYNKLGFIPIEIIDPFPGWDAGNPCQIMVKFLHKFDKKE